MLFLSDFHTELGKIYLTSDGENLTGLFFENQKYSENILKQDYKVQNLKIFDQTREWLKRYFNKEKPKINEISILPQGTDFRKLVWKILCKIPYGKVRTYNSIAKEIAEIKNIKKMSAQAIGGAVGHNPIGIIVPCHRVIGENGSLTGYAAGLEIKRKLLEIEKEF